MCEGLPLTKEQLIPEIAFYLVAGVDTPTHATMLCLGTIASHREVQLKINKELASLGLLHEDKPCCVEPRALTFEDLGKLTYLNCVIDETMRMYPVSALATPRETTAPTKIGPYKVPEGVMVWPVIYAIQNSTLNWDDPHLFKPERWLEPGAAFVASGGKDAAGGDKNLVRRFLPFSNGLKGCMGQALGIMLVRTVLATLLSEFWLELAPSMGTAEEAERKQQVVGIDLTYAGGLQLVCRPHGE